MNCKRVIAAVAAGAIGLSSMPVLGLEIADLSQVVTANAADVGSKGTCGEGVTYSYDATADKLTIKKTGSGSGEMYSYSSNSSLYNEIGDIKTIVIGDGVTSVGDYAFYGCGTLETLTLSSSVRRIGISAFWNCAKLDTIDFPSVEDIDHSAFYGCTDILSISFPSSTKSIGNYAFYGCTDLAKVSIPNSVTNIGSYAFRDTKLYGNQNDSMIKYADKWVIGCDANAVSSTINSGTVGIADAAFDNCTKLESIIIPNSVKYIGDFAFLNCSGLATVTIGTSVEDIGEYAFCSCTKLEKVVLPKSVSTIDDYAFSDCSKLKDVTIKNASIELGAEIFLNCSDDLVITGEKGSTSATYASEHGLGFKETTFKVATAAPKTTAPTTTTTKKIDVLAKTTKYGLSIAELAADANKDNAIDAKDAVAVLVDYANALAGKATTLESGYGDANADGEIDAKDAVLILQYYANELAG